MQSPQLPNGSEHLPIAVPVYDRLSPLSQPIGVRLDAQRSPMIARRPRCLGIGDALDVVQVDGIEVRRVQPREAALDAHADASRGIVERVPRVSEPSTFRKLCVRGC